MMQRWEYRYEYLSERYPIDDKPEITLVDWKDSISDWDRWGSQGWELVQIIPTSDPDGTMRGGVAILKRPVSG
jgi:hypothetical protein